MPKKDSQIFEMFSTEIIADLKKKNTSFNS